MPGGPGCALGPVACGPSAQTETSSSGAGLGGPGGRADDTATEASTPTIFLGRSLGPGGSRDLGKPHSKVRGQPVQWVWNLGAPQGRAGNPQFSTEGAPTNRGSDSELSDQCTQDGMARSRLTSDRSKFTQHQAGAGEMSRRAKGRSHIQAPQTCKGTVMWKLGAPLFLLTWQMHQPWAHPLGGSIAE